MAGRRKVVRRRRVGGKRVARKGKSNKLFATKQMAMITETMQYKDLEVNTAFNLSFNLAQFVRASAIAPNFKWYKAAKVEWTLTPLYNTFNEGTSVESAPYIYTVMNRTQDNINMSRNEIQSCGGKPSKFINKKTYKFVPNWCSAGLTQYTNDPTSPLGNLVGVGSQGLKPEYGYIACPTSVSSPYLQSVYSIPLDGRDPPVIPANSAMNKVLANGVRYNGLDGIIDQEFTAGVNTVCRLIATVTWIFKDPMYESGVATAPVELKEVV